MEENNNLGNYITIEKYSFWNNNRMQLILIVLCLTTSIYCLIVGSYGGAALNALAVVLNIIVIYINLPPKWVRQEMKDMKGGYSNKDFIDHLAEDFHSEVGIRIYDEK